ncbi:MAG: hypothetical protein LBP26_06285 [Clostridiales bacterium]|jgi:hypothetical protein|nr:hypothetical protein [Clostridiales bacterium]
MANEKNVTDRTETEVKNVAETNVNVETETDTTAEYGVKLYLMREAAKDKFGKLIKTKNGLQIYNYKVHGNIRGRETKIDFSGSDKGGFEPLDIVYNGTDKAELSVIEYEFDNNGKKQFGVRYVASSFDEDDGVLYKSVVRPSRKSDSDLMDMYLSILKNKAARGRNNG